MKKGVERRERGCVTSSAREAIDLWDKRDISHRPVYLCNRKPFGEVEEAADLRLRRNDPVAALIDNEARPPCLIREWQRVAGGLPT